jgi:hypothetical protein
VCKVLSTSGSKATSSGQEDLVARTNSNAATIVKMPTMCLKQNNEANRFNNKSKNKLTPKII